jgi:hypothetical protein
MHDRGYPVLGYAGSIYEWSWWLRGMEQFMVDLLESPSLAQAIIARVADFTAHLAVETARAGIDVLAFYDDAGSQRGMQISPELWRSFIKPAWHPGVRVSRAVASVRPSHCRRRIRRRIGRQARPHPRNAAFRNSRDLPISPSIAASSAPSLRSRHTLISFPTRPPLRTKGSMTTPLS